MTYFVRDTKVFSLERVVVDLLVRFNGFLLHSSHQRSENMVVLVVDKPKVKVNKDADDV